MKPLILLLLITNLCYAQLPDTARYSPENVIKITVRKHKNVTTGTNEIISNISSEYDGEREQLELITFYKSAYDYKVVDKTILKHLIDSLSEHGINQNIRQTAIETRNFIEHRFLGKEMRDFEFPDKDGNLIKLSSLRDKIVIIELWATWCSPCIKEMPRIPELRSQNKSIEFYSISLDKSIDKMQKFLKKTEYDWPIVFGGDAKVNKELHDYLHIVAIPKYYTIDRSGTVIDVADKLHVEYISGLE